MIDEKIVKEFKFEQLPGGKVYGVASSDDIGFKFQDKFVSLQDMFEQQDKRLRLHGMFIDIALIVALSHAIYSILH